MLLILTLFRFWYAGTIQLAQDEAYYWQWSRHLAWGYYDNPPAFAPVIRFFTGIFGATEVGVRAGAIVSALVASVFIYLIARRLFGAQIALISILVANIIPEFAWGAIIATLDPLQLAFWSATLYVILRAVDGGWGWWILAGVLTGITALSKLNGFWLLPSVLLYLAVSPSRRVWLTRPHPYVAAVIAIAIFSPFIWWNHTHQNAFWIHIGVMGSRSSEHDRPLKWFFRFLGDQALLVSPLLFLTLLGAFVAGWKERQREGGDAVLFVWAPTVTALALTALVSLRSKVEGNWPAAGYVSGSILIALALSRAWTSGRARSRTWVVAACALSLLLALLGYFPQPFYAAGLNPWKGKPSADRLNETVGWREMAARIHAESQAMGTDPFVFGINYRMPSEAAFYLPGQPRTYSLFLHDRSNEYMFWEDPRQLVGRDAILVQDTENPDHLDDVRAVFQSVDVQPPLKIYKRFPYGDKPIRTIQIFRCHSFKGYDVKVWQKGW